MSLCRFLAGMLAAFFVTLCSADQPYDTIDAYFNQVSLGNMSGILKLFDKDAEVTYPPHAAALPGGTIKGKEALQGFFSNILGVFNTRYARATEIVVHGTHVASALHIEGIESDGESYSRDNLNLWEFSNDGLIQSLRVYSGGVLNSPTYTKLALSLPNGDNHTEATVCYPSHTVPNTKLPLLIFSHGWRVAAEDYDYLCSLLSVSAKQQWVVALVRNDLEDPTVQPPLLEPLAEAASFLAQSLPSLPLLAGRLNGQVVLGGHSMGGGTSVLAASSLAVDGLALWAPGLYGKNNADATEVGAAVPSLILAGSSDCVNSPTLPLRAIDTYKKLGSSKKSLVMLKDANHCFFSTPVKGSCSYDVCTSVPRLSQQAAGLRVFQHFATAVLSRTDKAWSDFEEFLGTGKDIETGVEWESVSTSSGGSKVPPFSYPLCPSECCSSALSTMGLCNVSHGIEL